MKSKLFLTLCLLLLSGVLSAQSYHYQYAHDTLGNRISRVYQGARSSDNVRSATDTVTNNIPADKEDEIINDVNPSPGIAEKDTTKYGPFVKSPAEKEAYQDSMMAAVMVLEPLSVDGGSRDLTSYSVGAILLDYGISGSGARTYSVPILTAPDIKYAPSMSLVYNSQGGHGYGGYGWDLGGLSSITLTSESLYWDDNIAAASTLDYDGVFCLDGVRLVTNNDAATSSTFPLVTASGHILAAPHRGQSGYITSFAVLYPDGSRSTFGKGTDLGFTLPSYPMVSSTNMTGDRVEYCYTLDNTDGNHAIDSIRYGIDAAGRAAGVIRFTSTANSEYSYYAGKKVKRTPRITGISSFSSGTELYTYVLSYISDNGAYLLKTISLDNASGEQLPPLVFTYGKEVSPQYDTDSLKVLNTRDLQYVVSPGTAGFALRRGKFTKGNYNDGLIAWRDLPVYYEADQDVYACGFDPSSMPPQSYAFIASITDNTVVLPMPHGGGFQTLEAVDTDGDGVDELVRICCGTTSPMQGTQLIVTKYVLNDSGNPTASTYFSVMLNGYLDIGGHLCPYRRTYRWGDFLGNGKTQLVAVTYSDNGFGESQSSSVALINLDEGEKLFDIPSSYHMSIASGEDRLLQAMDIDGDGRTELCQATSGGLRVYRLSQSGYSLENTPYTVPLTVIDSDRTYYADINADGYIDIIQSPLTGSSWTLYTNTGLDFTQPINITICTVSSSEGYLFMDIDRDGYPDLMKVSGTDIGFYPNEDGMSFGSYKSGHLYTPSIGSILPPNVVDYTAMSSFVTVDGQDIREFGYTSYAHPKRHLVQSADSYGKIVRNTYGYLPQSSLYWTENPTSIDASQGYQLRVLPIYVLTGAAGFLSDASDAQKFLNESYSWFDGVVHTQGLGFCGFAKTSTVTHLDSEQQTTVRRFNPQKRGVPISVHVHPRIEYYPAFSITTFTYDSTVTQYGKLSPRLTQTAVTKAIDGVLSTTDYTYGSGNFDFPTKVTTVKSRTINGAQVTTKDIVETTYQHSNNPSRYVLGVVISQDSFHDRDGDGICKLGERVVYARDTLFRPVTQQTYKLERTTDYSQPIAHHSSTNRWQYDGHGNVIREESAPSGSNVFIGTSYTYDGSGRHLVSSTDAMGHTTAYSSFDIYGNPSTVTNHKGQQTHSYRDGWGRVTRTVHPDGTVDSLARAWGGIGVYTETSISSGSPDVVVDYDAAGRKVLSSNKRFDGQWQKVKTRYNERGLVFSVSLPYRGSSQSYSNVYAYDAYGRAIRFSEASGRETTWSYSGTSVTERKDGVRTTKTTNPAGQLVSVSDSLSTFTYTYRDDGQPVSVGKAGLPATTFTYDTLGRRTSIVDPSAGTRSTSYVTNADGSSVITETNALGSIVTSYDSLGRVASIARLLFNTTFSYDTCGRLVSKVSTNGTSSRYTYDQYDRVLTAKDSVPDCKWLQKTYSYNADGNRVYTHYTTQDGFVATEYYSYANGHLKLALLLSPNTTPIYNLTAENDLGQPTAATSGSVSRTYGYTAYGLPTYRKLNNGSLQDFRYNFDAATGNLTGRSRVSGTTLSESFSYDNLGRLTNCGSTISYDANNNITAIGGVGILSYSNGSHPYSETDLIGFNGSAISTASQAIEYTAYDRPATITQGDVTAMFTYDADYERAKMVVYQSGYGSLSIDHYIGDRYEVHWDAANNSDTQILYLGGDAYSAPMVLKKDGDGAWTPYVIGRDHLGSITHIATTSGTLVEERSYNAWGRLRNPSNNSVYSATSQPSLFLRRGFCGHEHLPLFGLINMNARLYDPVLGRFLSPDPYIQAPDFPGNFNRYSYCLNNPLKYVDPNGEFAISTMLIVGAIGAVVFGAGNVAAHAIREDDLGHGKWAEYFFSGALAGFVVGALGYAGLSGMVSLASMSGFWGGVGRTILWGTLGMAKINTYATAASALGGVITNGWDGLANAGKIILGNFYLDENKSFWGQVGEGILRHTWEAPQQSLGYFWSSARNTVGAVDRVDYLGGATFATDENHNGGGVSLGSYINYNYTSTITGDFESFVKQTPGYMHEYGHYIDSQSFGLTYLLAIGVPSLFSASSNKMIGPYWAHNYYWTETRANNNASSYFGIYYGVNWMTDTYYGTPFVILYPL